MQHLLMISSDQTIGSHRLHFTQVDSTNAEAKRLLDNGEAKEGLVITADLQTQGRGQYGRVWESEVGLNIMMSVVVSPIFIKVADQFALNILTSLAVADVVSDYSHSAKVKWPNDVYVHNKKIAGILIQNYIQGDRIKHSIIGIGLNVNQSTWPEDVPNATSLCLESGEQLEKEVLIKTLCKKLDERYKRTQIDAKAMYGEYQNNLFRKDESSTFEKDATQLEGTIKGIDDMGRLLVEHSSTIHVYNHGEISQVI